MKASWTALAGALALTLVTACTAATTPGVGGTTPAGGTTGGVTRAAFKADVAPLVASTCKGCHEPGRQRPTLFDAAGNVDHRAMAMEIREIIAEVSRGSMPKGGPRYTAAQVGILEAWKSAGTPND